DPLSFPGDRPGYAALRAATDRLDEGGRDHGRAPPDRVRGRCAVPPRIDPDAGREAAARQLPRPPPGPRTGPAMTPQAAIQRVLEGGHLGESEMAAVMEAVLRGDATPAQVAALLVGLRHKGEPLDHLVAAPPLLRAHPLTIPP